MRLTTPRLVLTGTSGDSGKTLVSLGLARAFVSKGLSVSPFKKGPDYIDSAWLSRASNRPGRNLDTFLMSPRAMGSVLARGGTADLMLVEGNRGLHDGFDAMGSHSTGELAKRLRAPVVLIIDATKMTRTAAALVLGCQRLDPEVNLACVVLNRVATARQEHVIRESIEKYLGVPVVGAISKLAGADPLPGRHLGLVTTVEHPDSESAIERARTAVERSLDLDRLLEIARTATDVEFPDLETPEFGSPVRVGVFRDEAFSFYYPENLEALEERGAEIVFISPMSGEALPEVDGLYLGGGFPEVHASKLAEARVMHADIRNASERGMPIYAECGGLIYLSRELTTESGNFPMAGVLDLVVEMKKRPQGHGYVMAQVDRKNPYFETGTSLKGHEFHYTRVAGGSDERSSVMRLERGRGLVEGRDGVVRGRTWASYMHLHAMGTLSWADRFLSVVRQYREERVGAGETPDRLDKSHTSSECRNAGTDQRPGSAPRPASGSRLA